MRTEDIDDIFGAAYEEFEEKPSVNAWQNINARLDRKAIASYKRRLVQWRAVTMLLLSLLVGVILFQQSSSLDDLQQENEVALSKQRMPQQEKSNELEKFVSTEKPSRTGNTIKDSVRAVNARTVNPMADFSLHDIGRNTNYDASASIVLAHSSSLPKAMPLPMSYIPLSQVSNVSLNTMKKSTRRSSPWALTGVIAYERANYRLDNDLLPSQEKSRIQQREEHEASYSTGVLATVHLRKHWSFQTGLMYSNTSIGIKPEMMYASHDDKGNVAFKYVTSSGYAYIKAGFRPPPSVGDSLTTSVAQHNLQSVGVPINVKYSVSNRRLLLQPGVGIAINFFTTTKVVTEIKDASHRESVIITRLDGTRPFYLSLTADANIQYGLANGWSVNLIPSFKYAVTPITKDHVVQTFPYTFGIGIGTTFKF